MRQELVALVMKPDEATYRTLQALIIEHPEYAPYSDDLKTLQALYEAKRYAEVQEKFGDMMPNWMLNPSVHQIMCLAAKHLGDERMAAMEYQIAEGCLQGILASGDGTPERPYPATHVEDEYDVLRHLELSLQKQSMISRGERHFDCMTCEDGSEIWFDITPLITHQNL